jgi:flagellar L-ring protein precursor FlgH
MKTSSFLFLLVSFNYLVSGCSSFVERIQADIYRQKGQSAPLYNNAMKQKTTKFDELKITDPLTYTAYGDNGAKDKAAPGTRKTRNDFIDGGNGGSLWGTYDNTTSFFTNAMTIRETDIIVLEVLEDMKKTITRELRKAYPPHMGGSILSAAHASNQSKIQRDAASTSASASAKDPAAINPLTGPIAGGADKEDADKEVAEIVYDKISTRVVERISSDHVILKGKKEVIFRGKKRYIEIEAMAKAAEIEEGGKLKSDKIIESRVTVLK